MSSAARYVTAGLVLAALAVPARAQDACDNATFSARVRTASEVWIGQPTDAGSAGNNIVLDVRVREVLRGDQAAGSVVRVMAPVGGSRLPNSRLAQLVRRLTDSEQVVTATRASDGSWQWAGSATCPAPALTYAERARAALGQDEPEDGNGVLVASAIAVAASVAAAAVTLLARRRRTARAVG